MGGRYIVSGDAVVDVVAELWSNIELSTSFQNLLQVLFQEVVDSATALHTTTASLLSLPELCCQAVGNLTSPMCPSITAIWMLYYAAAHLLDNLADRCLPIDLDPGVAANAASAFLVSATALLEQLSNWEVATAVCTTFTQTSLSMTDGQHLILTEPELTLTRSCQITEMRSGAFFAAACWAGARLATDEAAQLVGFKKFGRELGVLIQIGDDLRELWPQANQGSDLAAGHRWTLPVAYAMTVLPDSQRAHLKTLLKEAPTSPASEKTARQIILDSGAMLYLAIAVERRKATATDQLLHMLPPSLARAALLSLLEEIATRCRP